MPQIIQIYSRETMNKVRGGPTLIKKALLPNTTGYGNVYFHFNMRCVQKHNAAMNFDDHTIIDDISALLHTDHLRFVKWKGFL